jgi:hypothetical protein
MTGEVWELRFVLIYLSCDSIASFPLINGVQSPFHQCCAVKLQGEDEEFLFWRPGGRKVRLIVSLGTCNFKL